jgi:hypothetical protein
MFFWTTGSPSQSILWTAACVEHCFAKLRVNVAMLPAWLIFICALIFKKKGKKLFTKGGKKNCRPHPLAVLGHASFHHAGHTFSHGLPLAKLQILLFVYPLHISSHAEALVNTEYNFLSTEE